MFSPIYHHCCLFVCLSVWVSVCQLTSLPVHLCRLLSVYVVVWVCSLSGISLHLSLSFLHSLCLVLLSCRPGLHSIGAPWYCFSLVPMLGSGLMVHKHQLVLHPYLQCQYSSPVYLIALSNPAVMQSLFCIWSTLSVLDWPCTMHRLVLHLCLYLVSDGSRAQPVIQPWSIL